MRLVNEELKAYLYEIRRDLTTLEFAAMYTECSLTEKGITNKLYNIKSEVAKAKAQLTRG